jgi:hypothetical protein
MAILDGSRKCRVHWFIDSDGKKKWKCLSRLTSPSYPESNESCWYHPCPGRSMTGYPHTQEEMQQQQNEKISKIVEVTIKVCDNYDCTEVVAQDRKRYCSDKCRKQKARIDYEARNPNRKR